jgi:hypothetical protein
MGAAGGSREDTYVLFRDKISCTSQIGHSVSYRLLQSIVQKDVILKAPLLHAGTGDESWRRLKDL